MQDLVVKHLNLALRFPYIDEGLRGVVEFIMMNAQDR